MSSGRRGHNRLLSRRGVLMTLGAGLAAAGLTPSGAFTSVDTDRTSSVEDVQAGNAYLGLQNFQQGVVYKEPIEVTVTNSSGHPLDSGTNNVESANGDLLFRQPGSTTTENPLPLSNLSVGQSDSFEIVTPADQTGQITDTVTLSYSGSEVSFTVARDITVEFNAGAQLVYAVDDKYDPQASPSKGDIRVYDAVNDQELDPTQRSAADIIGANAADIVNDSNADIPYAEQNTNQYVYATWVGGSTDERIDKGKKPTLKKQKSRLALRPWPGVNKLSTTNPLILGPNSKSKTILAIETIDNPNNTTNTGNVEDLGLPKQSDGCSGVCGVNDIDGDTDTELVYITQSNQLSYLEQPNNSITNIPTNNTSINITVGESNSKGFGPPADFGKGIPEIPIINENSNPILVDYQGNARQLATGAIAKEAAVTPLDVDNDDEKEFMYIESGSGIIRYIDDVGGSNTLKDLTINGSTVVPLDKTGLNSGT